MLSAYHRNSIRSQHVSVWDKKWL